jgi:hypothetical protein
MSIQSIVRIESIPQTWNDETDTAFFTIVARLFSTEFTYGASVLLASFDSSEADVIEDIDTIGKTLHATAAFAGQIATSADLVHVAVRRAR